MNAERSCFQKRKEYGLQGCLQIYNMQILFLGTFKIIFCPHFLSIFGVRRILLSDYFFWGELCENDKERETLV